MACAQHVTTHQDLIIELAHHMGYWGLAVRMFLDSIQTPTDCPNICCFHVVQTSTYAAHDLAVTTVQVASAPYLLQTRRSA
jgi:hypothetical protein